tara:strand:- start:280 stop:750 length:471 start_codon:yes stop_codon:yes gene_type:complete
MTDITSTPRAAHSETVFHTTRFTRYARSTGHCSLQALPFVDYPEGSIRGPGSHHWRTDAAADYDEAVHRGQEYAAHLAQYLKDNAMWVSSGITAKVLADMGTPRTDIDRGYLVGFCSYLEQLLHATAKNCDIENHIDLMRADYDKRANRFAAAEEA